MSTSDTEFGIEAEPIAKPAEGAKKPSANVGDAERFASAFTGGALAIMGLKRGGLSGLAMLITGGSLVFRGATGHCSGYAALGVSTASHQNEKGVQKGILVSKTMAIRQPKDELYAFWRSFTRVPEFMKHIKRVDDLGGGKTHWVAKGPLGTTFEWDAELINDVPDELIAWQSLENADIRNAGSVRFADGIGAEETLVTITVQYLPPAGRIGDAVARLLGHSAPCAIEADLHRFKELMETGVTTDECLNKRAAEAAENPPKEPTRW